MHARPIPILLVAALLGSSAAVAAPDDTAVTAVGVQAVHDYGLGADDLDLLVSERLRWTLVDTDSLRARVMADARFTVDPSAVDLWAQNRVRTAGVELGSTQWTVLLGRHAVSYGGPRLVDGVQVLHRPAQRGLTVGVWGGLAPDLFTTRPLLRPGGGPILAWEGPTVQASVVGEIAAAADGSGAWGLDRVGLLTLARLAPSPVAEVSGRLDAQLTADGTVSLADGSVFARWRPAKTLRFDALYDAYSSLRYLQSADRDPDLNRFAARLEALGLTPGVWADLPDPSVYQLMGLGGALQGAGAVAPRLAMSARYRYHPRLDDRYARLAPQVGVLGLGGGRLDATVDLVWTWRGDTGSRRDVGLGVVFDPLADGRVNLDSSFRLISDPDYLGRTGWYTDLWVDVLPVGSLAIVAGVSATQESSDVPGIGLTGLLWVQHRVRRASRHRDQVREGATRLP